MRRIFWLFNMKVNEGDNLPSTNAVNFVQLLFHHKCIPFTIPSIILTQTYVTPLTDTK